MDSVSLLEHPAAVDADKAERRYCYHCRKFHDGVAMRRVVFKHGVRWRCHASIAAARLAAQEREAYGRQTTAINRAETQRRIAFINEINESRRQRGS